MSTQEESRSSSTVVAETVTSVRSRSASTPSPAAGPGAEPGRGVTGAAEAGSRPGAGSGDVCSTVPEAAAEGDRVVGRHLRQADRQRGTDRAVRRHLRQAGRQAGSGGWTGRWDVI